MSSRGGERLCESFLSSRRSWPALKCELAEAKGREDEVKGYSFQPFPWKMFLFRCCLVLRLLASRFFPFFFVAFACGLHFTLPPWNQPACDRIRAAATEDKTKKKTPSGPLNEFPQGALLHRHILDLSLAPPGVQNASRCTYFCVQ